MITKYIDNKELKRVIEDGKLKPFRIKQLLKKQGIILSATNSDQVAEQVYPILWGSDDIEEMSHSINDNGNYIKSSIIELVTNQKEDILDSLEDFFANAIYKGTRYNLSKINRLNENELMIKLGFEIIRPGRIEFISSQFKSTDIIVSKTDDNKAIVDVRQANSSEMKEMNLLLDKSCKKEGNILINHISLQRLTIENRVNFFDKFIKKDFENWRFETVTKVELKKADGDEEETKILDEEEVSALTNLSGIKSAILSGTSIRNNSFVQECIQNGFYISNMGYKFENISDLREVVIEINFKYDDIKIDICKTYEYDSDVDGIRLHPAFMNIQEDIIKIFQKAAYEQYKEILQEQEKEENNNIT